MAAASHLNGLNSAQRKAVAHGEAVPEKGWRAGPLLVIAGAGTGKTMTIAHRVAQLVLNGVDPARVHVVYEGIDNKLFCPGDRAQSRTRLGLPDADPTLLFVGNILQSKGAGILIEACARLRSAMGLVDIVVFNDSQTTAEPILAAFDRAIAHSHRW